MSLFRNNHSNFIKLKVCGIANEQDIFSCFDLGVDAVGFLIGDAKGYLPTDKLSKDEAKMLIDKVPVGLKSVLLIKSTEFDEVDDLISYVKPDIVQLQNANINIQTIKLLRNKYNDIEWIKSIKIQKEDLANNIIENIQSFIEYVDAVLLDSEKGGSGLVHDWNISQYVGNFLREKSIPFVLAGGLTEENIKIAIEQVNPNMLDVMTGVSINKGIKDLRKIATLMKIIHGINDSFTK